MKPYTLSEELEQYILYNAISGGWVGKELRKCGCVTYADEWSECPGCGSQKIDLPKL